MNIYAHIRQLKAEARKNRRSIATIKKDLGLNKPNLWITGRKSTHTNINGLFIMLGRYPNGIIWWNINNIVSDIDIYNDKEYKDFITYAKKRIEFYTNTNKEQ